MHEIEKYSHWQPNYLCTLLDIMCIGILKRKREKKKRKKQKRTSIMKRKRKNTEKKRNSHGKSIVMPCQPIKQFTRTPFAQHKKRPRGYPHPLNQSNPQYCSDTPSYHMEPGRQDTARGTKDADSSCPNGHLFAWYTLHYGFCGPGSMGDMRLGGGGRNEIHPSFFNRVQIPSSLDPSSSSILLVTWIGYVV